MHARDERTTDAVDPEAFERVMGAAPAIGDSLDRLALLKAEDREAIRELAAASRGVGASRLNTIVTPTITLPPITIRAG